MQIASPMPCGIDLSACRPTHHIPNHLGRPKRVNLFRVVYHVRLLYMNRFEPFSPKSVATDSLTLKG